MIKVIVSDMDGTLLDNDHRLNHETAETIRRACAAGYRFMLATGREFKGVQEALAGEKITCDYILSSGAEVRNPQQEALFSHSMREEDCRRAYEILKNYSICYLFCGYDAYYCIGGEKEKEKNVTEHLHAFRQDVSVEAIRKSKIYQETMDKTIAVESFEKLMQNSDKLRKIFIFSMDLEKLAALKKELETISGVDVSSSFYNNLEVTDAAAQKGPVLKTYIESLGYTMDEVMVFGDSMNDYSMLSMEFGATVAMENAHPEIKRTANYITKSNTENGVAWAIEQLMKRQNFVKNH